MCQRFRFDLGFIDIEPVVSIVIERILDLGTIVVVSLWRIPIILLRETLRFIFNLDPLKNKDRSADLLKFFIIDRGKKNSFPFREVENRRFLRVF